MDIMEVGNKKFPLIFIYESLPVLSKNNVYWKYTFRITSDNQDEFDRSFFFKGLEVLWVLTYQFYI